MKTKATTFPDPSTFPNPKPGQVIVTRTIVDRIWHEENGEPTPYAVERHHFVGRCIHTDGCAEDFGRPPAMLEAYAEWPVRDCFETEEAYFEECKKYKPVELHALEFFARFAFHNRGNKE